MISYGVVMWLAVTINFMIPRLAPGNPIQTIMSRFMAYGVVQGNQEIVEEYARRFGLDGDLFTQYISYLRELFSGRLGMSITSFPTSVEELIVRALPWTMFLLSIATLVGWIVGNLLGAIVGWSRSSKIAAIIGPIAWILSQIPYYIMALVLIFVFAYSLEIFPLGGALSRGMTPNLSWEFVYDALWHAALPMLSILIGSIGWSVVSMRALISNVLGEDYIMMAKAKGLKSSYIMTRYALKNALLPQVTALALSLGNILSGAILAEIVFAYPGLGWLLWTSVTGLDYPMIQGILLLIIFSVCTAALLIDLLYPLIDPRIRYGRR